MTRRVQIPLPQRLVACLIAVFLVLGSLLLIHPQVKAADASVGQGIQVSPVIIDLNGEKGGSYNLRITVTNVTAGTLVLKSEVDDFTANGETGNPKVILGNDSSNVYSMKSWVSPLPSITLTSKESRSLAFTVSIPASAEAGGHYAVVRFSGVPPDLKDANVSLTASVGLLLLTRVEGKITENLVLSSFNIQQGGKVKGLVANGPVNIVARIQNTGNVHVQPVGTETIKDTFGKVVATYPFGSNTKNVLPHTIRAYSQSFDKKWLFGRYTVSLQAAYGTTGGVLQGTTSFWVIPFKLIFFLIILIAIIVLVSRRLLGHYKRRIIHKSQNPKKKN